MTNVKKQHIPTISIIIVTKNVERTFPKLLESVFCQDYPKDKIEIIVVDGRSTDETINIINHAKRKIRLIQGKFPNDPEVCKGEGLAAANGEIVCLLDSDNYLPHNKWITEMVKPLIKSRQIVGSYPWRFAYRKEDNILNRYFSLIGSADPVGLYLGKADKQSYLTNNWMIAGKVIRKSKDYFIVQFNENNFPTLGSNGFFARKEYLLKGKADPKHFFHIDTPYDLLSMGLNTYAAVKDVVIHDTAIALLTFIIKRAKYMMLHYQKRSKERRYLVFDPRRKQDIFKLFLFVIYSLTFVQPLYVSIRGYVKIKDRAWFIHPILCFGICIGYMYTSVLKLLK